MNICCIRADILAKYDIYFCYNPGKTQFLIIIHKIKLTLVFQLDFLIITKKINWIISLY